MFLFQAKLRVIYMEDGAADMKFQVSKYSKKEVLTINAFQLLTIFTKNLDHGYLTGF